MTRYIVELTHKSGWAFHVTETTDVGDAEFACRQLNGQGSAFGGKIGGEPVKRPLDPDFTATYRTVVEEDDDDDDRDVIDDYKDYLRSKASGKSLAGLRKAAEKPFVADA